MTAPARQAVLRVLSALGAAFGFALALALVGIVEVVETLGDIGDVEEPVALEADVDRDSGDISSGGVANVDGDIYAGRDGNVYKRTDDGWEQAGGDNTFNRTDRADTTLDKERAARDRGTQRDVARGSGVSPASSSGASACPISRPTWPAAPRRPAIVA